MALPSRNKRSSLVAAAVATQILDDRRSFKTSYPPAHGVEAPDRLLAIAVVCLGGRPTRLLFLFHTATLRRRRCNCRHCAQVSRLDHTVAISDNAAVQLVVSPAALKAMALLSRRDRDALIAKAEAFATDPFAPYPWAAPLRGTPDRVRIRQGDWRGVVLILRARDLVILERVAHRREVYR